MTAPRLVLTRQREANGPWAARLRAAGHEVWELPLLRFTTLPAPMAVPRTDWIVFTSPQGARAWAASGLDRGGALVAALGPGTAAALRGVDLFLDVRDGTELAPAFAAHVRAPASVLLPGPRRRLREPRAGLEAAGFEVIEVALYETESVPATELPADPPGADELVLFCSPSAVRAFTAAWDARPPCVAIGRTTADALREAGFAPAVADRPTLDAMVRAAGLDPNPAPVTPENGS